MPQFDFSQYPAQIFWFLLCFAALYLFIAFVIIPRIKGVVDDRKSVIDKDVAGLEELSKQITAVQDKSAVVIKEADSSYKDLIAKAAESSKKERVKHFDKFKEDSENLLEKSRVEIGKVIKESNSKLNKTVKGIVDLIAKKILN